MDILSLVVDAVSSSYEADQMEAHITEECKANEQNECRHPSFEQWLGKWTTALELFYAISNSSVTILRIKFVQ